jgi:hypothetical protein
VRPQTPSRDNRVARSVLPSIPRCAAVVRMVDVKRPGQAILICEFMATIEPSNSHCAADFPPFAVLCVSTRTRNRCASPGPKLPKPRAEDGRGQADLQARNAQVWLQSRKNHQVISTRTSIDESGARRIRR